VSGVKRTTLKILQLSDSHLSADREADYRGLNADRNLLKLLPAMRAWDPDLVLLTGDISEDASEASYARAAVMLGTIGAPLLALPGNHDDPEVMKNHFPQGSWQGSFVREVGPWLLVLMDSTVKNAVAGSFSQHYLERFYAQLRGSRAQFALVALHHQPVSVNARWIDRFPLEQPELFFNFVDRDPRIRCVVWGHIHQDFRAERKGVMLLGAPSSAANALPDRSRFTLDMEGPACRWLELDAAGEVATGLLRPIQSSSGKTSLKIR
jgi:Icc protein